MNQQELTEQIAVQVVGSIHVANVYLWAKEPEIYRFYPDEVADEAIKLAEILAKKLIEKRKKSN